MNDRIIQVANIFDGLTDAMVNELGLLGETEYFARAIKNIAAIVMWTDSELRHVDGDLEDIESINQGINHHLSEILGVREKLNKKIKDTLRVLYNDLNLARDQRNEIRDLLTALEKQYKETSDELNKMR